jgi:renalase
LRAGARDSTLARNRLVSGRQGGMEHIAVIGAGMAGLSAAARLSAEGLSVTILEEAQAVGGRMASREFDGALVDAGALYATAREPAFQAMVQEAVFSGRATGWAPRGRATDEPWLVGLPDMGALLPRLGPGVEVMTGARVDRIGSAQEGYLLAGETERFGPFDAVIVATPASVAGTLLTAHGKPFDRIGEAVMRPTLVLFAAFDAPLDVEADYLAAHGTLAAAVRNGSRPGRGDREVWVLHASRGASETDGPADALLAAFRAACGRAVPAPVRQETHVWRHAYVEAALGAPCLVGPDRKLAACGDWCLGARVEAAFLSGRAAAEALLA